MRPSLDALDQFLPAGCRDDPEQLGRARVTARLTAVLVVPALAYAAFYGGVVGFAAGGVVAATGGGRPWG